MKSSSAIGLALALFIIGGFAIGFGVVSQRITSGFSGSVALGCLTFVGTTGLAIWQFNKTKRKEAEARIFAERAAIYMNIVDQLRQLMLAAKGWRPEIDNEEIAKKLMSLTYDMIIWGGQDTVRALMTIGDADPSDPGSQLKLISKLFRSIRKELGHTDDDNLPDDLVVQMIKADERESVRALLKQK